MVTYWYPVGLNKMLWAAGLLMKIVILCLPFISFINIFYLSPPFIFFKLVVFHCISSTYGMKQLVTEKTHIHGHILDLFITRDSNNTLPDVSVVPGISDHYAVYCSLDLERPPPARKTVTTRPLRTMDSEQFRTGALESLSAINFKTDSITSCVESYNNSLAELIDRLAPQKTRSVVVKPSSPWMTEEIHATKWLKRRLERKCRRTKSDYDRKAYTKVTKQRQIVSRMIEHSKTEYYSQCVSECVGNQKRFFTITDRLMHRKKEPVLPDTTCDLQLAEKFSQFYSQTKSSRSVKTLIRKM